MEKIIKKEKIHNYYRYLVKYFSRMKGDLKLLEIGAGECILKDRLPKNIQYKTLDILEDPKYDYQFDLNKGKMPIKDKTFDIVLCLETLEHTFYPDKILKEMNRIVKEGGSIIISLPNDYNFYLRIMYLLGIKKQHIDSPWNVVSKCLHLHRPRVKDILDLSLKHLKIKKVKYFWQSRRSKTNKLVYSLDKLIHLFAQIYPSLFARWVLIFGEKNKIKND